MSDPVSMEIINEISALRAEFQPIARTWLHIVKDDLKLNVRITETLRTRERQAVLHKTAASNVSLGWHNVGLAFDFALFDNRGNYVRDDQTGLYTKAGRIAQALDCRWPITISTGTDYGHVEWHPGFTLQQFLNGRKEGLIA